MRKTKLLKLNYGCGENKLKGFVNIDLEKGVKPDVVCDIRKSPLPYKDNSVSVIHCIHNLEHIERRYWSQMFVEFYRVLVPEGQLMLAYPEFERCAKNFLENLHGDRDFWRNALYGRQLYPGDYHVVPMVTSDVVDFLETSGFHHIKSAPEPVHTYNTFLVASKGSIPMDREQLMRKEIFQ